MAQATLQQALTRHAKAAAEKQERAALTPAAQAVPAMPHAAFLGQLQHRQPETALGQAQVLLTGVQQSCLTATEGRPARAASSAATSAWGGQGSGQATGRRLGLGLPPLPGIAGGSGHAALSQQQAMGRPPLPPARVGGTPQAASGPKWGPGVPAALATSRQGQVPSQESRHLRMQRLLCADTDPFTAAASSGR